MDSRAPRDDREGDVHAVSELTKLRRDVAELVELKTAAERRVWELESENAKLAKRAAALEATLTEACEHLDMAVDCDEDLCVLDPEEAQEERDWIERARSIAKGVTP